ncbi:MAG: hypothetical protein ACXWC9_02235 [Pseudobdellovibrionaceae bacterium]
MTRRLSDYSEFLSVLRQSFVETYEFSCEPPLNEILKEPRLIIAANHATPLSWLPSMTTLAHEFEKSGGGDRSPRGVIDRWFYSNPLTAFMAEYLSQYNKPQNFDDLLADFSKSDRTDLVVFPEGANTFFGDVHDVQEFRSSRFVELSIRAHAPILIVVHAGSEKWSLPVEIPPEWVAYILPFSKFFGEKIMKAQVLNFPWWPKKISNFKMKCRLYRSRLQESDLSSDPELRKDQIRNEAEHVRQLMRELIKEITESL